VVLQDHRLSQDLLDALDTLDRWPEKVRLMQKNWIGRSEGLLIRFALDRRAGAGRSARATRGLHHAPDTLFGASFWRSPPIIRWQGGWPKSNPEARRLHRGMPSASARAAAIETAEKKGFDTGIARASVRSRLEAAGLCRQLRADGLRHRRDLRLPAHDQRDLDFAANTACRCSPVVMPEGRRPATFTVTDEAYVGDGVMINSRFLDGMTIEEAKEDVAKRLAARRSATARGRAQGEFPPARLGHFAPALLGLPDPGHPLREPAASCRCRRRTCRSLPDDVDLRSPGNPLDRHPTWKHVACPQCGKPARRETDTMDTFVDSSWYFARFTAPVERRRADRSAAPITGCRSTSISAASSTRSCICSIRASSPAP
jgi:leucyl-tRNA synthetase